MGPLIQADSRAVQSKRDEHLHALGLAASESDDDATQSPQWSLAPFGWQRQQQQRRRPGPAATAWRVPPCAYGAVLSGLVLALLTWGGLHLAHGRGLHVEVWPEAASGLGGRAPAAPATEQRQQCQLPLDGSPWERHCQRLRRVCVDQGTLILHDDRYQQLDGRKAGRLPELLVDTSKIFEYPWRKTSSRETDDEAERRRQLLYDVMAPGKNRRIPVPAQRPATSQEPATYLQQPRFSTCTVPVLLYSSWRANFFHIFKDLSAQVYSLLRRTPWRQHVKLVVVTPDGLPLTQPEAQLLPRLSGMSVQTLADFSRRLPPGFPAWAQLDASHPPPSHEGGEQRCFDTLFFCGRNLPMATGLAPEAEAALSPEEQQERLAREVPLEPFSFGQAVAAHMQRQQQDSGGAAPAVPDAISLEQAAAAAGASAGRAATRGRLKVVLTKRGGEGRQILNSAELLEQCNAWRYTPPGSSTPVTAECREVLLPDLESGIAAAQGADILLGIHGANLANGWMMRPGSSVIEVTPYQFETGRGSFVFSVSNSRDATSRVLWWVAVLCDPAASTPGPNELAGVPPADWWPRDRNVRVPWATIDQALQQVVTAGGDQQAYLEQYYATGRHRLNFDAAGVIGHGGRCANGTEPARP